MTKNLIISLLEELISDDEPVGAPGEPVAIRHLPEAERRAYKTAKQAARRARLKQAAASGCIQFEAASLRQALADAAIMILATDSPGADAVMHYLRQVFQDQAGAAWIVQARARSGKIKPKLLQIAGTSI